MPESYHLFDAYGVELEYMIVQRDTLNVLPITDQLIHAVAGEYASEVEMGDVCWSNELVLHVVELKTNGPTRSLTEAAMAFQRHVTRINGILESMSARLLPTAMHPWMDPMCETKLWPHEYSPVYEAFNRIFDCRGHGWANLQALHLNLPFCGDEEFGRLHAAVRLILPILPALAASSPIQDGQVTGLMDNRVEAYRKNCRRVPSVTGRVIPEPVFTEAEYRKRILEPMYADIAPHDPEGILRDEWLNARGAIARLSRGSIEIRLLDMQECPAADLAIVAAVVAVLKALVAERWSSYEEQRAWAVGPLERILLSTIAEGERAVIDDGVYLRMFGLNRHGPCEAAELWRHLIRTSSFVSEEIAAEFQGVLDTILQYGPLARRIIKAVGSDPTHELLHHVYGRLAGCLSSDEVFLLS